jgi:signal transduction histidine kinase/CheY-like chemotaxis protein
VIRHLLRLAPLIAASAAIPAERLAFDEIAKRRAGDLAPLHLGREVTVSGVVAAAPVRLLTWVHAGIHDARGRGLTLEASDGRLGGLQPGDRIAVDGVIGHREGLPVVRVEALRVLGHEAAPEPVRARVAELASPARLGNLIVVEGPVIGRGDNAGGEILDIGNAAEAFVRVFLPRAAYTGRSEFASFRAGDRVRVVGLSSQYCPVPPYNRAWQIVISNPRAVTLLEPAWIISPDALLLAVIALVVALVIWWLRERMLARQRRWMRALTGLAEDVVSASTPAEISRTLGNVVPRVFERADLQLYIFNRNANTLDPVHEEGGERSRIAVNAPMAGLSSAVALCFRNRASLAVPDVARSPLFEREHTALPATALFIPMIAHQEVLGVLVLTFDERRNVARDAQAALQHVANQAAISLKLQEQKQMREQLLRSEKMAATGQLISGVAADLRAPLNTIRTLADGLSARFPADGDDLSAIAYEAERAGTILTRLVSFANPDNTEPQPVDLNGLLATIVEFRRREWETRGFHWETQFADSPLTVVGVPTQLEQVLLNLFVASESVLERSNEKKLRVESTAAGPKALIAIEYSDTGEHNQAHFKLNGGGSTGLGLQVCKAILQTHGGELRINSTPPVTRLEVELPAQQPEDEAAEAAPRGARPSRQITGLIVDPDVAAQRRLMALLAERGHRAIPVPAAEDGLDLSHRLKFDVVFCAVRLPGLNWVEFQHKVRRHIPVFVLLSEGYDPDLSRSFRKGEGWVVGRALEHDEVERVLIAIDSPQERTVRR